MYITWQTCPIYPIKEYSSIKKSEIMVFTGIWEALKKKNPKEGCCDVGMKIAQGIFYACVLDMMDTV